MESTENEGGTGGKFRKMSLRRLLYSPYDRPPLAARGIHGTPLETEGRARRWFSKLVDPASRVAVRSASRLLSAFSEGIAAPSGEHIGAIEEVSEVKSSPETREQGENPSAVRLSMHHDGSDRAEQELISCNDNFFELEQLLKQNTFPRAEIDRMAELLNSRIIEPSTLPPTLPSTDYKNKGTINEDSSINSSSSNQAVNLKERGKKEADPSELEAQREQLVNLHENTISGEHVNISEEGFDSPIEIAKAYMGLKPRKAAQSTIGLRSRICQRDSPLNLRLSNAAAIASRSPPVCFPVVPTDSRNDFLSQKARGRSTLYKLSRSPYCRTFMTTNFREYSAYKGSNVEPTRSLEWTPSLSNIRHSDHGKASKHGSLERDSEYFDDTWRVRQKSSLKELSLPTHVDTSSKLVLSQDNLDGKMPSSVLHVPPYSVEMERKILHQLDKLSPSPQNKSSQKQVIVGDGSFSKSSIRPSHEGSLKIKANNDSTSSLNFKGSRIWEAPSYNFTRITSSASPTKEEVEGEASLMPSISGAEVASCLRMDSSGTSSSIINHSMKSMEPTIPSSLNDKVEPTKAGHGIFAPLKEPMEKSFEHSFGYVPTSRLMHIEGDAKASGKAYDERTVGLSLDAVRTFNTLSEPLLFSTVTTMADGTTPKDDTVSPLKFGSKVSAYNDSYDTNPTSTGISTRLNDGSFLAASSSTGNGAPKFQFGSGNSTSYSFTGLSAVSSGIGIFSSSYPYSKENGVLGVSTSSIFDDLTFQFATNSSQNTAINFGAVASSYSGTEGISSWDGVTNFEHKYVFQFGTLDSQATSGLCSSLQASCSSQVRSASTGVKPFTSTSCLSSSSASLASCSNSSLLPAVPASFSTSSSTFLSSSSLSYLNPSPFQASASQWFLAGGSFSALLNSEDGQISEEKFIS